MPRGQTVSVLFPPSPLNFLHTPIIGDMGISLEPPNHPQPLYLRGICIQLTPETRSRRKEEKVADKDMVTQEERSVVFSWEKQSCNKCSTFSCWFN